MNSEDQTDRGELHVTFHFVGSVLKIKHPVIDNDRELMVVLLFFGFSENVREEIHVNFQ